MKQKYRNTHTTNSIQRAKSITNQICYHTAAITQHIASFTHRQNSKAINVYQQKKTTTKFTLKHKHSIDCCHQIVECCYSFTVKVLPSSSNCMHFLFYGHTSWIYSEQCRSLFSEMNSFFQCYFVFLHFKSGKNIVLFEFIMSIDEFHLFVFVKFGKDWYFGQQKRHSFLRCT